MSTTFNPTTLPEITRYQPLCDQVLLKAIEHSVDTSEGGIVIPEIAQVKSNKGRVVSIGEGRLIGDRIVPIPLVPGDVVLFSKYAAEEVKLDGDDYLLVRYDELKLKQKFVIG